jgi:hypothetical protein
MHPQVKAVLTWGLVTHEWKGHRVLPLDEEFRGGRHFSSHALRKDKD